MATNSYSGAVNMHKLLASGASPKVEASGKGSIPKYAKGGVVNSPDARRINDSSQKQPLPTPGGKIATLKKGGMPKKQAIAVSIAIGKRPVGRGR